ncbi:MAG: hypothetical protein JW951_05605 [Lentisphaerae bacterium]|nr:hypothetical protein [Lentisphaerota bacterium]
MAQDWDIKPRGEACSGCEQPFEDGQTCHSALVFTDAGYVRRDYCVSCGQSLPAEAAPYSTWQGVYRAPPARPEPALRKETAESLLRRLMEDDDPQHTNVRYILAVMLERKRLLIEREVQRTASGPPVRVYEHRRTGETFLIPDPQLRLDQLEAVQQEVAAMLGWQRNPEP